MSTHSQPFTDALATSILDFWFDSTPLHPTLSQAGKWFRADKAFDNSCKPFESEITTLSNYPPSTLLDLATTPDRTLALLLLLDQLPRNLYREDTAKVYTVTDPLALTLARYAVSPDRRFDLGPAGAWRTVPARRAWFYLPLEHSEDLSVHALALGLMRECMVDCAGGPGEEMSVGMEKFLREHTVILEKFGRYPYRNGVLGRESTQEEREWLEGGGVAWAR
jgi:uncharacterized protein (DUF924 family)